MNSALSTRAGQAEGGVCGFVSPHLRRWAMFPATIRCGFLRTSPTDVSSPSTDSGNSPAPATVGGLGTLKLAGSSSGCFAVPCRSEISSPSWPVFPPCSSRPGRQPTRSCSPISPAAVAAGVAAATARLRPDASPGPPRFTSTFDHLTVASFHPHHHPDQPCDDRHGNNKHQDGRHNTPPSLR
jgi:hypothetical protein